MEEQRCRIFPSRSHHHPYEMLVMAGEPCAFVLGAIGRASVFSLAQTLHSLDHGGKLYLGDWRGRPGNCLEHTYLARPRI